ncbi:hypothetical protein BH09VER1_BH09VER1_11280 [soil metagenome]
MLVERLVRSRRRAYVRVKSPTLREWSNVLRRIAVGCLAAILLSTAFTVWGYFLVALGLHPEAVDAAGLWSPLLALLCVGVVIGARAARGGSCTAWRAGANPALGLVATWFAVWCYLTGRYSPVGWLFEALPGLTGRHLTEWAMAVCFGLAGSICGSVFAKRRWLGWASLSFSLAVLTAFSVLSSRKWSAANDTANGLSMLCVGPDEDGTVVRFFTFDFQKDPALKLRIYDADGDDRNPLDDSNTSHMGQGIDLVARKLIRECSAEERNLLCVFNAGFFGLDGSRTAHHEAPIVVDGEAHYNLDLIGPKDQAWVFAVRSPERIAEGSPRFRLAEEIPWQELDSYETVLGGVRPLRVAGRSVKLYPGIGSTRLRCARTSIGWSADGGMFHVLIIRDPDTEGASNFQRRGGQSQTGGWDVREVQEFWEKRGIPNAVLLDGGESTQAAYQNALGRFVLLRGGHHVALPLGHLRERPLMAFPAMLPRLQNSRGVLNYLYVDRERL